MEVGIKMSSRGYAEGSHASSADGRVFISIVIVITVRTSTELAP